MNDWLERNRTLVLTVVGLAIIIPLVSIALSYQRPSIIEIVPPAPSATPGLVTVHVSGAVAQPDVYELPPGSIARDAINAAGGPLRDADLNLVNLAQPLSDGQQVYVPIVGEEPPPLAGTESEESGPVNINTATAQPVRNAARHRGHRWRKPSSTTARPTVPSPTSHKFRMCPGYRRGQI